MRRACVSISLCNSATSEKHENHLLHLCQSSENHCGWSSDAHVRVRECPGLFLLLNKRVQQRMRTDWSSSKLLLFVPVRKQKSEPPQKSVPWTETVQEILVWICQTGTSSGFRNTFPCLIWNDYLRILSWAKKTTQNRANCWRSSRAQSADTRGTKTTRENTDDSEINSEPDTVGLTQTSHN